MNENIKCPYCGSSDYTGAGFGGNDTLTCNSCGKIFIGVNSEMVESTEAHGCGEEKHICYYCGRPAYIRKILIGEDDAMHWLCDECNAKHNAILENADNKSAKINEDYPQAHEKNEYRYLSPAWLDEIAKGLTAGQEKYPGETWREIPAREHAWRAIRHLMLYLKGDKADTHLINAAMRTMMAFETDAAANDVIEWEKLMREKGCG